MYRILSRRGRTADEIYESFRSSDLLFSFLFFSKLDYKFIHECLFSRVFARDVSIEKKERKKKHDSFSRDAYASRVVRIK